MAKITISYRRADADAIAGRIRDRLAEYYSGDAVYMDIDSIPFGTDFREHIREALLSSDVLLAIIGPKWLGQDASGTTRIMDPTDPVRIEVETALEARIPVVPVLIGGAAMPKTGDLPPSLESLAFRNAAEVSAGRDFHQHIERLIHALDRLLKRKHRPFPWDVRSAPQRRSWLVPAVIAAGCAVLGIAATLVFWSLTSKPPEVAAKAPAVPPVQAPAAPVVQAPPPQPVVQVARKYVHATGSFEREGEGWVEYPPHQYGYFRFMDRGVIDGYLYLVDTTRVANGDRMRPFHLRIPVKGGMSQWFFPNPFVWQDLFIVAPAP